MSTIIDNSSLRLVSHQINNLQTKIDLLSQLPPDDSVLAKIKNYRYQLELRIKLANFREQALKGEAMNMDDLKETLANIRKSHQYEYIAQADKQIEEELISTFITNKHIPESTL